jgi:hypothetical protein
LGNGSVGDEWHTRPGEETRRERNQPYQTEQDRYTGYDLGIDPSRLGPHIDIVELVEEPPEDTGNDL